MDLKFFRFCRVIAGWGAAAAISPLALAQYAVTVNPTSYNYGSAYFGHSVTERFTVYNGSLFGNYAQIYSPVLNDTNDFTYVPEAGDCSNWDVSGGGMPPGYSCTYRIDFGPKTSGPISTTLVISGFTNNIFGGPFNYDIPLTGTGLTYFNLTMTASPSNGGTVSPGSGSYTSGSTVGISALANASAGYSFSNWSCSGSGCYSGTNQSASVTMNSAITEQANFLLTAIALYPSSLTFPSQLIGTYSAPQTVTVTNSGTKSTTIQSIGISPSNIFQLVNTSGCIGATLSPYQSCSFQVTFTPAVTGVTSGSVVVTPGSPGQSTSIPISGTGYTPITTVSLSPSSLTFPSQTVGTSSNPQTVTLSNTGNTSVTLNGAPFTSGDFSQTNNCPNPLPVSSSCTINVTFKPSGTGTRSGTLSVYDNATGSPQTTSLTGNGTPVPVLTVSLSPTSLTFPSQTVGTSSNPQSVTVTNTGNTPVNISSASASGDFSVSNQCPSTLNVGASCNIAVTFAPAAAGTRSGTLYVYDNANGSPQTAFLSGTGASIPTVSLSPPSLNFGSVQLGFTSPPQNVTLANTGSASVSISSISTSGDFSQTNNCPASLNTSSSCTIAVRFAPTAYGSRNGTLSVYDNASGSPQTVSLTGTGANPTPTVSLTPSSLTFGSQTVGTTSSAQSVTLSNTGSVQATISSISANGDFGQTNNP